MEPKITSREPKLPGNSFNNKTISEFENAGIIQSNLIALDKLSEFYLLPPFENASEPYQNYAYIRQHQGEDDRGFTSYFQNLDKATGKISLLLTGGHFEELVYPTAWGNDEDGYFTQAQPNISYTYNMLPIPENLKLKVNVKPALPPHTDLKEVFRIIDEPSDEGNYGVEGTLVLKVYGYTDNIISEASYVFLKAPTNGNFFYNPRPEIELEIDLLKNTDKIIFEISFQIKCMVPHNYSQQGFLTGRNYAMIDFRENESVTHGCILPDYFLPCSEKPAPGPIIVPGIKCEFWRYVPYLLPNTH